MSECASAVWYMRLTLSVSTKSELVLVVVVVWQRLAGIVLCRHLLLQK